MNKTKSRGYKNMLKFINNLRRTLTHKHNKTAREERRQQPPAWTWWSLLRRGRESEGRSQEPLLYSACNYKRDTPTHTLTQAGQTGSRHISISLFPCLFLSFLFVIFLAFQFPWAQGTFPLIFKPNSTISQSQLSRSD